MSENVGVHNPDARADRRRGWWRGLVEDAHDVISSSERIREQALQRAHARARRSAMNRLASSAYGGDREVHDTVEGELRVREQEALGRSRSAADKVAASRKAEARVEVTVRLMRARKWVAWAAFAGFVGLFSAVDISTGPGTPDTDSLSGWQATASSAAFALFLCAIALG